MNLNKVILFSIFIVLNSIYTANAHFGMIIPSSNIVNQQDKYVQLTLSFSHPFEGIGMDLEKPEKFYVIHQGDQTDLLTDINKTTFMDHQAWMLKQPVKRPGVYHFVMEPQPYWEPAEDLHIIHYTKTTVAAFGDDEGWDSPVGLPTEIIPRLRPFGNYVGNTFSGQVLIKGKPAANTEVEIEFYNAQQQYTSPSDYHITQVVKTDAQGIFQFTCNLPGWWGFSALSDADYTLADPKGKPKGVELGAVLWLYFSPIKDNDSK